MNETLFKYHGTVSTMTVEPQNDNMVDLILMDMDNPNKSPMRITAYGALAKYVYQIQGTDAEERYISSDWCYDRNLVLHRIEVPSKEAGEVAKIITSSDAITGDLVIFGPQEYIETSQPEPMSAEQNIAWYRFIAGCRGRHVMQEREEEDDMEL